MQLNLFGFVNLKKCCTCKKVLKTSEFYKNKRAKDGLKWVCKKCENLVSTEYYKKNKYKIAKYKKRWNNTNRDKLKGYVKKYNQKNKKLLNQRHNIWAKNKYYNENLYRLKTNTRNRIKNSFYRNGYKKNTKTAYILGTDWNTLKKHIENEFTNDMSWDNFDQIHIDHRIPLAAASTEFEVIALNHYTNLQPLWAEDNLSKSDKYDPEDFKIYMDWYTKNIKAYPEK